MVDSGATVAVDGGAQQAQRAHLGHDVAVKVLMPRCQQNAGLQFVLAIGAGCVANGALVFAQLIFKVERVIPRKRSAHVRGFRAF